MTCPWFYLYFICNVTFDLNGLLDYISECILVGDNVNTSFNGPDSPGILTVAYRTATPLPLLLVQGFGLRGLYVLIVLVGKGMYPRP